MATASRSFPALLLLGLLFNGTALGQADRDRTFPKTIAASSVSVEPSIDGRLLEDVWAQAVWISDFTQKEPVEGARPSQATEVALVYSEDALLVGARMTSQDATTINSLVTRRDVESNAERLAVSLDTYLNRRTAYTFAITAGGARIDYFHDSDSESSTDYSFDPVWSAAAHVGETGWTAEMRIPFSQLRFNDAADQLWGLNINRTIPALNEDVYWVMVPKNDTGWSSRFGSLTGIQGIRPARRLELLPYVATGGVAEGGRDEANPFSSAFNSTSRVGLDAKVGLGPSLTLDMTVNPDFGQVEADPAEVNLTEFETFFDERRPFFTEGSDLLAGSHFYSRRIGARPRGSASGDYVDRPDATTILGAAKLSGRLSRGLSVAALAAVTQTEHAEIYDASTAAFDKVEVEPFASYTALAAQQEVGRNASTLGFKATAVNRAMDDNDPVASLLNRSAYTGEVNWHLRFRGGDYIIDGAAGFTSVSGTADRIARLQRSPVHYYQRPDADHVDYDPTRTSLNGYAVDVWLGKNAGAWTGGSFVGIESSGYNPNDLGRLGRADEIAWFATINYRENERRGWFHRYSFDLVSFNAWNMGGKKTTTGFDGSISVTWKNYWFTEVFAGFNPLDVSDTATRGGPRMAIADERNIGGSLGSNRSQKASFTLFGYHEVDALERRDYRFQASFNWQPNQRLDLSIRPGYSLSVANRQYVAQRNGGPEATFGTRYIFSLIDRSEVSGQLRVNYTFRPDLTLELYAEPFAASGAFYRFGELAEAGGLDVREYGADGSSTIQSTSSGYQVADGGDTFSLPNRDFNFTSFRSNAVLRWEWRPGSTLFLVWQQDRSGFDPIGSRVRPGSLWDSVTTTGNNFVGLKVSYWLPAS